MFAHPVSCMYMYAPLVGSAIWKASYSPFFHFSPPPTDYYYILLLISPFLL